MAGSASGYEGNLPSLDFDGQRAEWTLLICMGGVDDDER